MELSPLSATPRSTVSTSSGADDGTKKVKSDNRSKAQELARPVDISNYKQIKDLKDLETAELSDDKKIRAQLKKTASKVLKSLNIGNPSINFHITGPFHDHSAQIPQAKLVANMNGEEALNSFFKPGLFYKLFGWIPRLFGAPNKAIGAKWLKANSGFMVFDAKGEHSHLDDLALVREKLKSGRFALSVVYKADDKGNFTKEPEAMVLVDTFNNVISDIEKHSSPVFKARAGNMKAEGLDSFFMPEAIITNPKSKAHESKDEETTRRYRKEILSSWAETHNNDANIIIPGSLFKDDESESKHHLFEKLHDMSFLYYDSKAKSIGIFGGDATLVRSKHNKYKLPETDLATMLAMAMLSEHSKDYTKLSNKFKKKLEEDLDKVIASNTQAFKELNERLGL